MTEEELAEDIRQYGDMLFRLAYSCTGDLSVCDDIVQEVLIKHYRLGKSFGSEEGKRAWLVRVTVNACRSHTRAPWRKRRRELPENAAAPGTEDADELIALRDAIRRLKPIYREVIYLHYYEGYTAEQIGKMLGLTTSAVTSRLKRGRELLKHYLE